MWNLKGFQIILNLNFARIKSGMINQFFGDKNWQEEAPIPPITIHPIHSW
jgi:hypothetical protein